MFPPSSLALCSWPPISLFRPHLQSGYGLLMLAQWHAQLWKRLTRNSGPGNLNKTKDRQECRLFSILERPPPTPNKTLQSRNKEKKRTPCFSDAFFILFWNILISILLTVNSMLLRHFTSRHALIIYLLLPPFLFCFVCVFPPIRYGRQPCLSICKHSRISKNLQAIKTD